MKTISTFFCAGMLMSALCAGFVACNEPKDTEQKDPPEEIGIAPVPVSEIPEEVAAFFKENLPPRSKEFPYGELEPVFYFGEIDFPETECFMINSVEEFKAFALPSLELPVIDFEKHTLIIGQHEGGSGCRFKDQGIDTDPDVMILNLIYETLEGPHHAGMVTRYYWGLYPKLPKKPVTVDVSII